jgi:2-C-methyl-D-erythritol 4-phosphate cytidylyltransferase
VFARQLILDAYEGIGQVDGPITDDAQLVEAMGHPVSVVESDISNLKITRPDDVRLAVGLIRSRPKKRVGPRGPFEEAQW